MADTYTLRLTFRDRATDEGSFRCFTVTGKLKDDGIVPGARSAKTALAEAVRAWVGSKKGTGWSLYRENDKVTFRDAEAAYGQPDSGLREFLSERGISTLTFSDTCLTDSEKDVLDDELFDLDEEIIPIEER